MTQRWDAARAASTRSIRKYKPVGPVGNPELNDGSLDVVCLTCGYVDCNCTWVAPPYGTTRSGVELQYNSFVPRGRVVWSGGKLLCGLLRIQEWEGLQDIVPAGT